MDKTILRILIVSFIMTIVAVLYSWKYETNIPELKFNIYLEESLNKGLK